MRAMIHMKPSLSVRLIAIHRNKNTKTFTLFFFSFIEEKKNQKEELLGSLGYSDLCGGRVRALPRHLATF